MSERDKVVITELFRVGFESKDCLLQGSSALIEGVTLGCMSGCRGGISSSLQ